MVEDVSERREPSLLVAETSASLEPQPWSVFGPPSHPSGPSSSVPVGTRAGPRGPLPFAIVSLDPRQESGSRGVGRVSWARSWTVAGGAELKTRRGGGGGGAGSGAVREEPGPREGWAGVRAAQSNCARNACSHAPLGLTGP